LRAWTADRLPNNAQGDPFRACGAVAYAAQSLGYNWADIDITLRAIWLIEKRVLDALSDVAFEVPGTAKDLEGEPALAAPDECQFLYWAVSQAGLTCDRERYRVGRRNFERSDDPRPRARR
jgi:hypothetical protein